MATCEDNCNDCPRTAMTGGCLLVVYGATGNVDYRHLCFASFICNLPMITHMAYLHNFGPFSYNSMLHTFLSQPIKTKFFQSKCLFSVFNKTFVSAFFKPASNPFYSIIIVLSL